MGGNRSEAAQQLGVHRNTTALYQSEPSQVASARCGIRNRLPLVQPVEPHMLDIEIVPPLHPYSPFRGLLNPHVPLIIDGRSRVGRFPNGHVDVREFRKDGGILREGGQVLLSLVDV